jgi:hypothetical protein
MACLPMRMLVGMTAMACTIAMAVGAPRVTTAPAPAGFDCKTRHLAMEFGEFSSTPPSPGHALAHDHFCSMGTSGVN